MAAVADAKQPQDPVAGIAQPVEDSPQGAVAEDTTKESLPLSVFRNTEPMREEQVQNAVKFLSHPKVRGSPVIYRRSFLERKGLTKEEIDEAFRRVPDPAPTAQAPAASAVVDAQIKLASNDQPLLSAQSLPPASTASAGAVSSVATIARPPQFHWTHAIFAVGLLAVSGAGTVVLVKNTIIPRLKSWIRKIASEEENEENTNSRPSSAEEAAAAAKAAAAAAVEVARSSQEMLSCKVEEKKYFGDLLNLLDVQLREMKSMNNAIQKLEGHTSTAGSTSSFNQDDNRDRISGSRVPTYPNGKSIHDPHSVRSTSPPKPRQLSGPPHPQSYMEMMVQRGERPPNIQDIDDSPPDPARPISNRHISPRAKPREAGPTQNSTGYTHQHSSNEGEWNYYMAENGVTSQTNGGSSVPWWQKKNVRITELDQDDELKTGTYSSQFREPADRSTWVPPQPTLIATREAAESIRMPKATAQKELPDDQLMAPSFEMSEESQKVMEISESGGVVDVSVSGMLGRSSSEIKEEQEHN